MSVKLKLRVPETLEDIKLSQYQAYLKEVEGIEEPAKVNRIMVKHFCGLDDELINKIYAKDLNAVITKLDNLFKDEAPSLVTIFEYDGVKYGFEPNLSKISFGAQIDIEDCLKDPELYQRFIGIIYRPITKQKDGGYLIEPYKADGKELDVPMNIFQGARVFFYNLIKILSIHSRKYINQTVAQAYKRGNTANDGVGLQQYIDYVKATLGELTKLPPALLTKYWYGSHTNQTTIN